LSLPVGVLWVGDAGSVFTDGLEFEHFGGEVSDGLADFLFLAGPSFSAEFGEVGSAVSADVSLDEVHFCGGDVEA